MKHGVLAVHQELTLYAQTLTQNLLDLHLLPQPYAGQRFFYRNTGKIAGIPLDSDRVRTGNYNNICWLPTLEELATIMAPLRIHIKSDMDSPFRYVWEYSFFPYLTYPTDVDNILDSQEMAVVPTITSQRSFRISCLHDAYHALNNLIATMKDAPITTLELVERIMAQTEPFKSKDAVDMILNYRHIRPSITKATLRSKVNTLLQRMKTAGACEQINNTTWRYIPPQARLQSAEAVLENEATEPLEPAEETCDEFNSDSEPNE